MIRMTGARRRWLLLVAAMAVISPAAAAAAPPVQDSWSGVQRIVAVGDVHGDHGQFVKVLRAAKLIDANDDWVGGKSHLVQTGDVLDRGPDSRKSMDLLMKLEPQAARAGGAVHALIGNHEAMVLLDDWRYVHAGEEKAFGGRDEYRRALAAGGKYGRWIRGHNTVIRINDVLFVHAGLTTAMAGKSITEINQAVRGDLLKGEDAGVAMDSAGPLWDRTLAVDDEGLVAGDLAAVLKARGAARMVVGHTVSTAGIEARAGGRLIRIDVGMSKFYGGPAMCLVIEKGECSELRAGEKNKRLLMAPTTNPATGPASDLRRAH